MAGYIYMASPTHEVLYSGNLKRLNGSASFDNVIILGREQPAACGMSDKAMAIWCDSEEPLQMLQVRLVSTA